MFLALVLCGVYADSNAMVMAPRPEGDGEWIMDTPTLQSIKWWSTGLPSSTHAIVYAQLILAGKSHGVHVFLVQLRGGDLEPLPGVEVGDIGAKAGDNDCAIGYLRMQVVRIPRRHLMEKRQHVTPDGTYVRHGVPQPSAKSVGGVGAGAAPPKPKSKAHYITMLKTRVALVNTAGGHLAKACVIAARYSAVRHQGPCNPPPWQPRICSRTLMDCV